MKRMIWLVSLAMYGQPAWVPVYTGCSASPCEVAAAPSAVVEYFAGAFKNAAIEAPVTSDGIGTVIKAFRDGMNVVIKVRERDGGALIITQSAAAQSADGAVVTSSRQPPRYSATSVSRSPLPVGGPVWPAFFVSLDPMPPMPPPKPAARGCLESEIDKAIAFMHEVDDLLHRYSNLFKRNGYAAEIEKKRSPSMTNEMHYFDVYVWGRSESTTLRVHLTRFNATKRFTAKFRVCRN